MQVKELFDYLFNAFKIWVIIQPWEQGLRVRKGKKIKLLNGGIYFKIPYFDSVYVQETRLRVVDLPIQTLTSKDFKTITLSSSFGYSMHSIQRLFDTLYHPEVTIANIASSEIADYVFKKNINEITPEDIEKIVLTKLNSLDYGLKFEYFKLSNFAVVRTYRLIQDTSYMYSDRTMVDCKR